MYSHFNYILFIKNDSLNSDLTQEEGIYSSSLESRHLTVFVSTSLGFAGNSSVKNPESASNTGDPSSIPWVGKFPWRRDQLPMPVFLGFRGGSDTKESACNAGDLSSIIGLGRFPGGGHGNPLQWLCLENPHRQRSLADYNPWGHKELDTTEWLSPAHSTAPL